MDERDALIAALQQQIAEQQRQIAEKDRRIADLTEENSSLASQLEKQKEEISELKQKLGLNSHNSSISSEKEGFNKPPKNKSMREASGKNPGAQKGHKGANLNLPHKPYEEVEHFPEKCRKCPCLEKCSQDVKVCIRGGCSYELNVGPYVKVTSHHVIEGPSCPHDKSTLKMKGRFPDNIRGYIQYGDSFAVLSGLLSTYGAVSVNRIHDLLSSMFGVSILGRDHI